MPLNGLSLGQDLTLVQKTIIDTLHKEGQAKKVIAKSGCSERSWIEREEIMWLKICTSNRDNCNLERTGKEAQMMVVIGQSRRWFKTNGRIQIKGILNKAASGTSDLLLMIIAPWSCHISSALGFFRPSLRLRAKHGTPPCGFCWEQLPFKEQLTLIHSGVFPNKEKESLASGSIFGCFSCV